MSNSDETKQIILTYVKIQAFKSFIFAMKMSSHTLRFEHLEKIFDLPIATLCSITCKMIRTKELKASLDYETKSLIIGQNELTILESHSSKLSQKINIIQNINEKFFDAKFGGVGFQDTSAIVDSIQTKRYRCFILKKIGIKKTTLWGKRYIEVKDITIKSFG